VPPDVLIDPDHPNAVEPAGIGDEQPLALGQDGVVRGVPGHPEAVGDPGDGQVLDDESFQRPPQPSAGQLRARLGGPAGVLAPHASAVAAAVAANRDQQRRGPPPERLVGQPPGHRVPRETFAAAPAASPLVRAGRLDDSTGQHHPVGLESLPGHFQAQLVEPGERRQISTAEARTRGSVVHVEVFRMGGVRAPILGKPRPSFRQRRASPDHTLICEEPPNW
jgi:hypothetical protein